MSTETAVETKRCECKRWVPVGVFYWVLKKINVWARLPGCEVLFLGYAVSSITFQE